MLKSLQIVQELFENYQINLLNCVFITFIVIILLIGLPLVFIEPYLPPYIAQGFRYGKFSYKGIQNSLLRKLEIPKAWYRHFYVLGFVCTLLGLGLALKVILSGSSAPDSIMDILDFVAGGKERKVTVNSMSSLLAMILFAMQLGRRSYESNFTQIFSLKSKMNVLHYSVAHVHYFCVSFVLLANTEGFVRGTTPSTFSFSSITLNQYIGCFTFFFCWTEQYKSNLILINLRKDATGKKVTESHLLPEGGFFELISSPHMFFEVGMYFAISMVIPTCKTWTYVLVWVICNQTQAAWFTHKWYKENFKDYPKRRYALYPYIL